MSPTLRQLTRGALLALALVLAVPALAAADAPDVTSARGFVTENADGSHTVRVEGTWAWNTHNSDCNDNRTGVGVAIDWGDSATGGYLVTTLGGNPIEVGNSVANSFNGGTVHNYIDNVAHPAEVRQDIAGHPEFGDITTPADYKKWRGGCGARAAHPNPAIDVGLDGNPLPVGTLPSGNYPYGTFGCTEDSTNVAAAWSAYCQQWGDYLTDDGFLSHTYGPGVAIPQICALTYDVHGKDSIPVLTAEPSGAKEVTAGGSNNDDNSAEKNASTFRGNTCFTIVLKNHPTLTTHAVGGSSPAAPADLQDRATLSGATANAGGTITFELFKNDNTCQAANEVTLTGGDGSFASDGTTAKAVNGNDDYWSSKLTNIPAGDTYYWVAHYSGDANNDPADTACADADETVAPGANLPVVVTLASGDIFTGISDKATISGLVSPAPNTFGTIDFDVYLDDPTCSVAAQQVAATESVAVTGNGDYFSTLINPLTTAGTYYFKANYNPTGGGGTDTTNLATNNTCHAVPNDESLVVDKAPTSIVTVASPQSGTVGASLTDTATLSGATTDAGGTITFTLYKDDATCTDTNAIVYTSSAVTVTGNGNYDSTPAFDSGTTGAGTYYWVASYTGDNKNSNAEGGCGDPDEVVTISNPPNPPSPPSEPPAPNPGIHIEKTGPASAPANSAVAYLLDVSNTGDTSFAEANVVVTDPQCSSSPTLVDPGGKPNDSSPGTLDPGDHWFYTCSVQLGTTAITNVGFVNGTDTKGNHVSDDDDASTTPILPQIAVEPLLPGSARLRGPAGCISGGPHKMVLTGRRIAKVVFFLDGKKVKTRTKADRLGRFTYTVNRKNLRTGVHTIVARVTYLPNTTGGTKRFKRTFAKCARALRPQFTG